MADKTVVIQKTKNFKMFKGVIGNRGVAEGHVAELSASISRKNMLAFAPIIVNEHMEVIDGQHRLTVARNNNLDVYYVVMEGGGVEEIQMLNATNRRWQPSDFLDSYIALGKQKYIEFGEFVNNNNLSIRQGLGWIIGHEGGHAFLMFRRGLLTFAPEDIEQAEIKAGLRQELIPYFIDTGYNRAAFFRAINHIVERRLQRELINKVKTSHIPLRSHTSVKDFMRMFEDVLNWRRQKEAISLAQ